jgi:hypothetical protein
VAEMQIGSGGIEAGLDAERAARFFGLDQALAQFVIPDDFREALFQVCKLFVDGHLS